MVIRYVLVGLVLAACGTPEATKPQGAPPPARAEPTPPSPTPVTEPPPQAVVAPVAPKDKPVHTSTAAGAAELARAIAPYVEQGRTSYPDAKRRYLAGLPPSHGFYVMTTLHSPGAEEMVFIAVTSIQGDQITGRIASDILSAAGYKTGDVYKLSEHDLIDWLISKPDGSEEGNVVGKFLDKWNAR